MRVTCSWRRNSVRDLHVLSPWNLSWASSCHLEYQRNSPLMYLHAGALIRIIWILKVPTLPVDAFVTWLPTMFLRRKVLIARAIPNAVTCRFLTSTATVQSQDSPWRICGGRSGSGASYLQATRLSLSIIILPMLHTHLSSRVNFSLQHQFYNSESGRLFDKKAKGKAIPVTGREGP
jgi:hypothetical protein